MGAPKESKADRDARRRERRLSEIDQQKSAQEQAAGITTDLRAIYGLRGIPLMMGSAPVSKPKQPTVRTPSMNGGNR